MNPTTKTIPARPYALIVRATERCLVGCEHCCISATSRGSDMTAALFDLVVKQARSAGVGLLHFSGGEPLLNEWLRHFVGQATEHGIYSELTTSTFTTPEDDSVERLDDMLAAGLKRLMISYDAAHARRVDIVEYARFMREAQQRDFEICALVAEWPGSDWPLSRVREDCEAHGVDGTRVDWCKTGSSAIGRAGTQPAKFASAPTAGYPRCPYVLTAPTVSPDGTVLLCSNAQSDSRLFRLGNVTAEPLGAILNRLQESDFYRALAAHGPRQIAVSTGVESAGAAHDMCVSCQAVLRRAEHDEETLRAVERLAPPKGEAIPLDVDALLPGHRRFVRGEERPLAGCHCE